MAAPLQAIYTGDRSCPTIPEARSPQPRKVAGRETWDGWGRMGIAGRNFAISEVLLYYSTVLRETVCLSYFARSLQDIFSLTKN